MPYLPRWVQELHNPPSLVAHTISWDCSRRFQVLMPKQVAEGGSQLRWLVCMQVRVL